MATSLYEPSRAVSKIRDPLTNVQDTGTIVNPPRASQLGGLDEIHEPYGHYQNNFKIKPPGSADSLQPNPVSDTNSKKGNVL